MPSDPLRLYHRMQVVSHGLRKVADRRLRDAAGISTAQAAVLAVVDSEQPCTQREVAEQLGLGESAVTPMVGRMVDAGLLERWPSPTDRRAHELHVTPHGHQTASAAAQAFGPVNDLLREALGDDGRATLHALLSRVQAELDAARVGWQPAVEKPRGVGAAERDEG